MWYNLKQIIIYNLGVYMLDNQPSNQLRNIAIAVGIMGHSASPARNVSLTARVLAAPATTDIDAVFAIDDERNRGFTIEMFRRIGIFGSQVEGHLTAQDLVCPVEGQELNENEIIIQEAIEDEKITAEEIPQEFLCAISFQVMFNPVYDPANPAQKYERSIIECWLRKNGTNPFTRSELGIDKLQSDDALKQSILNFIEEKNLRRQSFRP